MNAEASADLEKCKGCWDLINAWTSCLSCIYFETNYPWEKIANLVLETWEGIKTAAEYVLNEKNTVICNTRLINLKGDLDWTMGISVPWVKWSVNVKYKIELLVWRSVMPDDIQPISKINLFFNKSTPAEVREITRAFKSEIEQIVIKAFYWEK